MGEASDLFKATAAGTAREQFAHLEQAGGRIVEKVRGEAEDHGLTSDSTQALVRDIGAKVSAVAAATKQDRHLWQPATEASDQETELPDISGQFNH